MAPRPGVAIRGGNGPLRGSCAPEWRRRYAGLPITARLKEIANRLEDLVTGGSTEDRLILAHLSWAIAHVREAGLQAETGEARGPRLLQDDLHEARLRQVHTEMGGAVE